jgi:hypothetical protein
VVQDPAAIESSTDDEDDDAGRSLPDAKQGLAAR